MKRLRVVNDSRGVVLADAVGLANRPWLRVRGLLGTAALRAGEGLALVPCAGIHTVGMRFPIDVLYLDRAGRVLRVDHALAPGRVGSPCPGCGAVVELAAGAAGATAPGDRIGWVVAR